MMKYYFAPLEGITNYRYRKIHNKYFNGIDKYFIPFLSPNMHGIINKDRREIDPKNNDLSVKVVPQIISKNYKETVDMIKELERLGYDEINLNFGCPSGTVVAKGKGGGMLKDLKYMEEYLKYIFDNTSSKISIKLRIGLEKEDEFLNIISILNKFNIYELIVHPRTVKDLYSGPLHLKSIEKLDTICNFDIIYNGDIKSKNDIEYIKEKLPFIKGVMLGRGLVAHPDLFDERITNEEQKIQRVRDFYYELKKANFAVFGPGNSICYEKEIWSLLVYYFDLSPQMKKKIFKCKNESELDLVAEEVFNTCKIGKEIDGIERQI